MPPEWGLAYMVLLPKEKDRSKPELFRNIALTNTSGKIFFAYVAQNLESFMVVNKYIDTSVQKGFLKGIAGCLEHTFNLHELLREAYENSRQIAVTWIDLANAYGSVAHNMIQHALEWYHIPNCIRQIIFSHCEHLAAKVITREWSTDFFIYDIGLFQGCVMSTILFDITFNLLLDYLKPLDKLNYAKNRFQYRPCGKPMPTTLP